MKVLWHIWDGAAAWIVDELVERGHLPTIRVLRSRGEWGAASAPFPNCQTPAGLATLLTGTTPRRHGVHGFWVAGSGRQRKQMLRGFDDGVLQIRPAWIGRTKSAVSVHAPWTLTADGDLPSGTVFAMDGLNARVEREGALEIPKVQSETPFPDTASPDAVIRRIGDVVELAESSETVQLGQAWTPVWREPGLGRWYRAMLDPDTGVITVARSGAWRTRIVGAPDTVRHARRRERTVGPFLGDSMGSLYRNGTFGRRLADGGDGAAEDILLEAAEIVVRTMTAPFLDHPDADLGLWYVPVVDDISHEVVGLLDSDDPEIADAAWAVVVRTYELVDSCLGKMIAAQRPDGVVVSADHGMAPIRSTFLPNVVLRSAGLAVADPHGEADTGSSDVWYHEAGTGLVLVNARHLESGYLDTAAATESLRTAVEAICSATDGEGRSAVVAVLDADGNAVEPAAVSGSEATLVFRSDVLPVADLPADDNPWQAPRRSAAHVTNDGDPRLSATYVIASPGCTARRLDRDNAEIADLVNAMLKEGTTVCGSH
ncbi:alkaline phosphatase family protein [Curtobacterium sp. VKM Ac-1376]|uniref:alkaline phosphatase family protein n=1 Tax=Curtobacterium sp. VKM Ac-1376 TaxID=123312 RepID=UPI00188D45A1|nr:alkaline phosphatase family protein [Curtobacterium sp. VKM Ac-1376]MBF4615499.1 alkaline phosphatase family protein [Curtobacterium sp. VKM Ac-1376]